MRGACKLAGITYKEAYIGADYLEHSTFYKTGKVPTAAETCEANNLEIEELEALFPDGYHRGAVKIAGLRVR